MKPSKLLFSLLISLSIGLTRHAEATSGTWNGGGNGSSWNSTPNWGGVAFPNATTDTAAFTTAATITTLGQNINIASLTQSGTGNVSITDNSYSLTFNGASAITSGAGQNLTLNVNTTLAAATTISAGSGSIITFGSGSTLAMGNFVQTLTGSGGTIDINSNVTGGGSSAEFTLTSGVTVNLAGSLGGTYSGNGAVFVQSTSGTASTLNLLSNTGQKIQLGKAAANEKASLFITANGVDDSGIVLVSGTGAGGASSNVFIIGANISTSGGTATYNAADININNVTSTNGATVILSANSGTTVNFNTAIGSASGTTGTFLQVAGGGTVVFGTGLSANSYITSTAANGTEVMSNTILQLNDSAGTALTGNTTVDSGSSIQLLTTNQMPSGTLVINGAGGSTGGGVTAATGALENKSGTNTFAAPIALGASANATISSDANTLTLTGGIALTTSGYTLTFAGPGNTTVSTTAITGAGGLAKLGTGALTLSSANTYTGASAINAGQVNINSVAAVGTAQSLGKGTTINLGSGASTEVLNYTGVTATLGGAGGTINVLGTGTGPGTNLVQNSGAGTLTLANAIVKSGTNFTVEGAVNISGVISGSAASSDMYYDNATSTVSAAGTYTGPTHIYNTSTVTNGINEALPDLTGGASANSSLILGDSTESGNKTNIYALGGYTQTLAGLTSTTGSGTDTNEVIGNSGTLSTLTLAIASGTDSFTGFLGNGTTGATNANNLALAKSGAGTLVLTAANTYTGGTSITAGKVYATNSSGSATGTAAISVSGSTALLGVASTTGSVSGAITVATSGTFYSGGVATGTPSTVSGSGAHLSSALNVNGGNLTFALSNTAGTALVNAPSTSTSYLKTTSSVNFGSGYSDTITLVDLTNGGLTLRMNSAYLLIQAGATALALTDDELYTGLVIAAADGHDYVSGGGVEENGYVLGVSRDGSINNPIPITINQLGADGVMQLNNFNGQNLSYLTPELYLYNGDLEVVPEPGTWALMLGGLGMLVVIQRRRRHS